MNISCIDVLKLRTYELSLSSVHKYLLSLRFSLLSIELYKLSEQQCYWNNGFNSMLMRIPPPYVFAGASKIYTDFPPVNLSKIAINLVLTLYIDTCIFLTSWSDGIIFLQ